MTRVYDFSDIAQPEVEDLDHAVKCEDCQAAESRIEELECECGYFGDALIVASGPDGDEVHCPVCGLSSYFTPYDEPDDEHNPDWRL